VFGLADQDTSVESLTRQVGDAREHLNALRAEAEQRQYELLDLFLKSPGKIFSRASLLAAVWPEDVIVTERTVDVNITRIRKKLGAFLREEGWL